MNPHQRPEGRALAAAAKRANISARLAATRAGMSDARWRQIVNGYQSVGAGQTALVIGPADTLARMAQAVGLTADELRAADRADAADALDELYSETVGPSTDSAESDLRYRKPEGMSDEQWRSVRQRTEAYLQGLLDQAAGER